MLVFLIGDDPEKKPYTKASTALLSVSMMLKNFSNVKVGGGVGGEQLIMSRFSSYRVNARR
jgi:hypothetical protein